MVGENISHYKILEKLGEGGMGVVYKARDTNLDRNVALKFLPPGSTPKEKDKLRFQQEAKAAAQLNHPNICGIHAINEYEGQQFIEMEYIEGQTLRQVMNEAGTLSLKKVRKYALGIAEALSAAHRENIIHRDIKPENIMVDKNDRIKVMDFGLAKLKGAQHVTKSGSTVGTVTYMSPEQMQSEDLDPRSDIFSFGVVLYEMLSGTHPFQAEYEQALMFKILNEDPEPPSSIREDVPADLDNLVSCCLQKYREKRYDSAYEIMEELQGKSKKPAQSNAETAYGRTASPLIPDGKKISQKYLAWAVPAVLLALLLAFVWYYPATIGLESEESIPEEKRLIVLPFNNLSPETIPTAVIEGITEILSSKITQMEIYKGSLSLIPNSEVKELNITSIKEAKKEFDINLAVTSSIQQTGTKYLLTINLINALNMKQIRSSLIEIDLNDHNQLLDEVVNTLTSMLEVELEPGTRKKFIISGTNSSRAYQLYVEGNGYLSNYDSDESLNNAVATFKKAIESDSTFVKAYAALAETYWRRYEMTRDVQWSKEAMNSVQEALRRIDKNESVPEAYITLAMIYNGMERNKEALEMLNNLEGPESNSYEALKEKAKAYEGIGNLERAEELYKNAIERKDEYWDGYNNMAKFYYSHGRYEDAIEFFQRVTEIEPTNIWGYNNLAGTYYRLGKMKEAHNYFKKSLEVRPSYVAYTNLGIIYYFQNRFDDAINMYEKALELRTTDSRVWGFLGYAQHWSGKDSAKVKKNLEIAIEKTEKELEVTPNNTDLISNMAGYHAILGNDEKCRNLIEQLTSFEDHDANTRISIIHLYELIDNREAALQWAEKSLKEGYSLRTLRIINGVDSLMNDPQMKELMAKQNQ